MNTVETTSVSPHSSNAMLGECFSHESETGTRYYWCGDIYIVIKKSGEIRLFSKQTKESALMLKVLTDQERITKISIYEFKAVLSGAIRVFQSFA